ncbi:MAG: hypothetical protein K2G23_00920, partial [Muribaculaceae bacterium]|nr:hypothetical protein [Muribaculaceae bacterium]
SEENEGVKKSSWTTTQHIDLTRGEEEVANAFNSFSAKLMREAFNASEKGDFCISPISTSIVLSMIANAADEPNCNEICELLGVTCLDDAKTLCRKLMQYLPCEENGSCVALNNSIFMDNNFRMPDEFASEAATWFNADLNLIDFSESSTAKRIQQWLSESSDGNISTQECFIPEYTFIDIMFINSVYFKGDWNSKFQRDLTSTETFFGIRGESTVDMMHQVVNTYFVENDDFRCVSLNFEDGKNSIELYLPAEGKNLSDVISKLSSYTFYDFIQSCVEYKVTLSLPAFKSATEGWDNTLLENMGLKNLRHTDLRQFGIDKACIEVMQAASLKVDEDGAEFYALTQTNGEIANAPQQCDSVEITFDRPFVYIIRNKTTGAILLAGAKAN